MWGQWGRLPPLAYCSFNLKLDIYVV